MSNRRREAFRVWALTIALAFAIPSCGDDGPSGPSCVNILCDTGAKSCIGNTAATCNSDGLSHSLSECGSDGLCVNGDCQARKCFFPGHARCEGDDVKKCNDTGTASSISSCGDGEICAAGQCHSSTCTPGEIVCGWRELARCNATGDGWDNEEACASNEICVDGACTAETCSPETVICKDEATQFACGLDGSSTKASSYGHNKSCYEGYGCQPKLCSLHNPTPDVAPPDEGPPPPPEDTKPPVELEPLDETEMVLDGEKIVFTSNQSAHYIETENDLRILMDKGLRKIEISLKPLEEFDVGHWTDQQAGDVNVTIYYHDGSPLPAGAQFKFVSVNYDVELLKFQAKGGRVKGTFSGSFTGDGGATTIPFTDGYFDVQRHD